MISRIKEKISLKKLALILIAVFVVAELVTVVAVSESFLNAEKFSQSEKAKKIIEAPLSSDEHLKWLDAKGESVNIGNGELSGISVKNNNTSHSYVIMLHPLTQKPSDMASYAYHFYELGFNVYIPDYIGKTVSMGVFEKDTVLSWINYVCGKDSSANVFVFGIGLGGTSALMCTGFNLPSNVKGIISDSGYCDTTEVFKENIDEVYNLPSFPTVTLSSLYVKITKGWSFSREDILNYVKNSTVPILYIHGTEDTVVSVGQSNELYEVTRAKGTGHFTIHGADHAQGLNKNSEKYWREVDDFIRNSLDF